LKSLLIVVLSEHVFCQQIKQIFGPFTKQNLLNLLNLLIN